MASKRDLLLAGIKVITEANLPSGTPTEAINIRLEHLRSTMMKLPAEISGNENPEELARLQYAARNLVAIAEQLVRFLGED